MSLGALTAAVGTAADVLLPATAAAIRRQAATPADSRTAVAAVDRTAVEAADRTAAADMGGNIALGCFPA